MEELLLEGAICTDNYIMIRTRGGRQGLKQVKLGGIQQSLFVKIPMPHCLQTLYLLSIFFLWFAHLPFESPDSYLLLLSAEWCVSHISSLSIVCWCGVPMYMKLNLMFFPVTLLISIWFTVQLEGSGRGHGIPSSPTMLWNFTQTEKKRKKKQIGRASCRERV